MDIIKAIKEQKKREKEEAIKAFNEAKEYTKDSFSKEHRKKVLEENIARITSSEMKELSKNQYTTHIKLMFAGLLFLIVGFLFPPLFLIAVILLVCSLICMIKNRKIINSEYKNRKNIK